MARILLVEDSELVLRVLEDALEDEGHEVIEARDGQDALRKFLEEKPDLVITDCLIPKMDGFKLVKNIRDLESDRRTPVVMTSSIYRRESYRKVALEAGADLYLAKPSGDDEREDFKHRVNHLVGMQQPEGRSSGVPRA
ncbi:MAG: response regulator [Actinomycetota bacterium]|nr:response regulator [Actinomycetota bacterium]